LATLAYIIIHVHPLFFVGAVALENLYPATHHHFVNTEFQCSGLESNITNCTQNTDEAASCPSFGIASVTCHCKYNFAQSYFPQIESVRASINILQLEHYPMHPALTVRYDSAMVISQERAGWRSASTMPGALCVMMDGIIQMLPLSAGSWDTIQLVRIPCTVVKH